ncbi:neuroblast differentiation-associated protein AHNAK [Elysia marginata]|uniref:Neuroblast differentiation-associated protein AHNAK n=1 Tax=Elysia marginata TaxID=1093978 RepID=A0AAV4HVJ1_9GAST|nr:neuroblast differentiation-associated protein AHNAK [Elysia marginata]
MYTQNTSKLAYAGDVDFVSTTDFVDVETIQKELADFRLHVNTNTTEYTLVQKDGEDWKKVKKVGSLLGDTEDIERRKQLSSLALQKLSSMWIRNDKVKQVTRLNLYRALVKSILLYNCGTWSLTKQEEHKLNTFHRRQLRTILNIKYPTVIKNNAIYQKTGFGSPNSLNHNKPKEFPKSSRERKTWSSLPPTDRMVDGIASRLDRQGSCGSWDDGFFRQDPEVISVTLESQDIIGLGFNISGNMSSGIQISEVHNRGPAKDSGIVAVGDRILSVSVSYENIVYEDALTILSYASPYPVKLLLEKSAQKSQSSPILGPRPRRLSHPLFRSRSEDAMDKRTSPSPKRSRSSVTKHSGGGKGTSGRLFLKWKSGGRLSGSNSGSKPSSPEGKSSYKEDKVRISQGSDQLSFSDQRDSSSSSRDLQNVTTEAIVSQGIQMEEEDPMPAADVSNGKEKDGFNFEEIPLSPLPVANEVMMAESATVAHVKAAPPGKPERKNRRKSDLQNEQQTSLSPIPSQTQNDFPSPEPEVHEETIVPAKSDRDRGSGREQSEEDTRDLEGALNLIRSSDFSGVERPPPDDLSPLGTPVEEEAIVAISRASAETNNNIKSLPELDISGTSNKELAHKEQKEIKPTEKVDETQQQQQPPPPPPGLDDETLERIIAMNSFAPGTQGWAGLQAGGIQGGVRDDFIPDHPMFTSYPVVGDNYSISSSSSNSTNPNSSSINRGLAYEIRDDIVAGRPVVVGLSGKGRVASSGRQDSAASDTTTTSSGKGHGQGEGSECSDTLDWSGQRLVRSPSFSNIFVAE